MKKLPLAIVCFIMLHCSFGQGYRPMPDTLAVWVQSWEAGWGPMNNVYSYENIYTSGKTTLNALPYVELRRSGFGKLNMSGPMTYYNDSIWGYYRSDTLTGKVFFRKTVSDTDRVMYDFSLHVGDTIPITTVGSSQGIVIDSVDTVWIEGYARRRLMFWDYSFIPGAMGAVIEGIGNVHGLGADLVIAVEPAVSSLDCYRHGDSTYMGFVSPPNFGHPFPWHVPCVLYNSLAETEESKTEVDVKGPFENMLRIELAFTGGKRFTFKLFDALGKQIKHEALYEGTTALLCANISAGIYFWQVEANGKTAKTGKLIFNQE